LRGGSVLNDVEAFKTFEDQIRSVFERKAIEYKVLELLKKGSQMKYNKNILTEEYSIRRLRRVRRLVMASLAFVRNCAVGTTAYKGYDVSTLQAINDYRQTELKFRPRIELLFVKRSAQRILGPMRVAGSEHIQTKLALSGRIALTEEE